MNEIQPKLDEPIKAGPYAFAMAFFYCVIAAGYIWISSTIAANMATSVEELEYFELMKGMLFVAFTAAAMLAFNYALLRHLRKQQIQLLNHERNRSIADQVALAGTFAGAIAHDINNALTVATLSVQELIGKTESFPEQLELAQNISKSITNIEQWNRRLFDLGGRKLLGEARNLDVVSVVADCVELTRRHRSVQNNTVELQAKEPIYISGVASTIQRAVLNLILNSAEAIGTGGIVRASIVKNDDETVTISVDDNGPGVPDEMTKKIFEPFFSTKTHGSGLGLASVVACAQVHGGRVGLRRSQLGGACFEMTLQVRPSGGA